MFSRALIQAMAELFAEREESGYRPRPSMMGPERCIRQSVYHALGYERKPFSGRGANVLNDSAWHEELTLDTMAKSAFKTHSHQMGITLANAFPWADAGEWKCHVCEKQGAYAMIDNRDCHGHLDWIATDYTGKDYLIEHKALSMFGWDGLHKLEEFHLDYLSQMACYLRGVQLVNPDLHEGVLLCKNKNQSGYLELRCSYSSETDSLVVIEMSDHNGETVGIGMVLDNIFGDACERFRQIDEYRRAKKLPKRQYTIDTWQCDYCPFGARCWADYVAEHSLFQAGQEIASEEIVNAIRLDRDLLAEEGLIRKKRDELQQRIKDAMDFLGIRHGFTPEFEVEHIVGEYEKKKQVPTGEMAPQDRLKITKRKKSKGEQT